MIKDMYPRRGITFKCPCGCAKEYGVPLPADWILVPEDVKSSDLPEFTALVARIDLARLFELERAGVIAVKSFLHQHGSATAGDSLR